MLGAMAPVPRAIPVTASGSDAASCCCSEKASAIGCVSVGGCNGCTTDGDSGTGSPSGDLHCDPSMSCVLCLCGIGIVAIGPSIPEPMISDLASSSFEPAWSSIELPPAQPPPEGTFFVS